MKGEGFACTVEIHVGDLLVELLWPSRDKLSVVTVVLESVFTESFRFVFPFFLIRGFRAVAFQ